MIVKLDWMSIRDPTPARNSGSTGGQAASGTRLREVFFRAGVRMVVACPL